VRLRHLATRLMRWVVGLSPIALVLSPRVALAQVNVTPNFSITPSKAITPWIYQMAIGAIILGVLILLFLMASYMRFAPKFSGRAQAGPKTPPGTRPARLDRTAAPRQAPGAPTTARPGPAAPVTATRPAPAARTATAVAERPGPTAAAASVEATAPASGEPAVQADAVGQAEAAEPEARPTAKAPEEVGEDQAGPKAEAEAPAVEAPAEAPKPAAEQPSAGGGHGGLDQETFERVLGEQLEKGVDRRVAEGRARAAAVVAARKKAQG